ncbi:hypothetical protein [Fodinibius halophilus]|uniref:hypothetical protein n=1 Tax=Fodinibius halophilus TaxID=1736908 RepID=UPI00197AA2FE|nr:hypothetical protein [Fodinibius halophilus]
MPRLRPLSESPSSDDPLLLLRLLPERDLDFVLDEDRLLSTDDRLLLLRDLRSKEEWFERLLLL